MLKGIMKVLIFVFGRGLVSLGYGKEAMEARKELGEEGGFTEYVMIAALILCILFIVFFVDEPSISTLIPVLAVPAGYALWCVHAKKTAARYIEKAEAVRSKTCYAQIEEQIPLAVKAFCKEHAGDKAALEKFLSKNVRMNILRQRYAEILLEHFAPPANSGEY